MKPVTGLSPFLKLFFSAIAFLISVAVMGLTGCASKPSAQEVMDARTANARPSKDTVWTDRFYWGQPSGPSRDVQNWDFFYKDCELARKSRRPTRSEWECKAP
ncbi:MAG: hypothetical protein KF767_07915 [Bdellovibrionaceae bacterium]|nr:hypothetical protein [Pseudobdellovibrionaceae bacterium]